MKDQHNELFTELCDQEAAAVNGGGWLKNLRKWWNKNVGVDVSFGFGQGL